jgi:hypothetical protein
MALFLKRIILGVTALTAVLSISALSVLARPQVFFPYQVTLGRLELRSDQPFDKERGLAVLKDVEAKLRTTSLDHQDGTHRAFVANDPWVSRLVFLWNNGAGGVNWYPVTRNAFLRAADIDRGLLFKASGGGFVAPPRTLAYYVAHEIGHSLTGEHMGVVAYVQLPVWVREGVADYVGFGSAVDVASLARQMRDGHPDLDPKTSGLYARYRLLVAYLVQQEGWSIEKVLAEHPSQIDVEKRIQAAYGNAPA